MNVPYTEQQAADMRDGIAKLIEQKFSSTLYEWKRKFAKEIATAIRSVPLPKGE